ncbi:MAG: S8 family serine peptidase, partial [Planctomycetota bacterium]
ADDAWAFGASIGPAADGRIKPDVSYWYDDIYTTALNGGYQTGFGGTSAATPETAGTLGLMLQLWSENVWETDPVGSTVFERQPHASTIRALLINNSQQYDFVGDTHDLSRYKQGWGRPSAEVAYERAATSLVVNEEENLQLNDTVNYSVAVPTGETELKVTMVYPDPPGTTSSSMHRINDVNLKVTSPSAVTYHGNVGLEVGTESTAGGSPDDLNTVENVFVVNPEPGIWDVEIDAPEINQDAVLATPEVDVTFALVVTGAAEVYAAGAAQLRLTPAQSSCEAPYEILVRDGNVGSSTLTVDVRSDTETTPETVTLQETTSGSGHYTGSITATSGAPSGGDGMISVADGDTVTVEYVDADDGGGGIDVMLQQIATTDCVPPLISQVIAGGITDNEATLTWITNEPATSAATWGASIPPGQPAANSGSGTTHGIRITGLTDCTTYYYSVSGDDRVGNTTQDDNGGAYYLFTTLTMTDGQLHSCREGTLVIEADAVSCAGNIPVRLIDADLNLDPMVAETVPVYLTSSTETDPEVLMLTETASDSGEFTGSLPTGSGPAVGGDGILQTAHADLVTGRHDDADDGTGNPSVSTYTVDADCEGAEIQSVLVSGITNSDATVSWTTTEPTTGDVGWGTTPGLGNVAPSGSLNTAHSVNVGILPECGRIYFRV